MFFALAACSPDTQHRDAPSELAARDADALEESVERTGRRWTGECPDWSARVKERAAAPDPDVEASLMAAALDGFSAEAALCMAGSARVEPADPVRLFFWLALAEELGADVDEELGAVEEALPNDVVDEQRLRVDVTADFIRYVESDAAGEEE